jgi:hypothetical protein
VPPSGCGQFVGDGEECFCFVVVAEAQDMQPAPVLEQPELIGRSLEGAAAFGLGRAPIRAFRLAPVD